MVIGQPCLTHHSIPGESRSFALSRFWSVILSPGTTSARAGPPTSAHVSASIPTPAARQLSFFAMVGSPLSLRCSRRQLHSFACGRQPGLPPGSPADGCVPIDGRGRAGGERLEDELLVIANVPP